MSVLKQRNRIVVFRLSDDEYESLRVACLRCGRTMSDFTRSELLASIAGQPRDPWEKLDALQTSMRRIENLMSRLLRKPKGE